MTAKDYKSNVFINCAFDPDFKPMLWAIVFAIHDCGYIARCAMEIDDGVPNRIDKIFKIMSECKFGVHDLSVTEPDPVHNLPRFNMPLELGMFLGGQHFGNRDQRSKSVLILENEPHSCQVFISDLAGKDPQSHDGDPKKAMARVRNWLNSATTETILPGPKRINTHYQDFTDWLPTTCEKFGIDPEDIQFNDYVVFTEEWLKENVPTV